MGSKQSKHPENPEILDSSGFHMIFHQNGDVILMLHQKCD